MTSLIFHKSTQNLWVFSIENTEVKVNEAAECMIYYHVFLNTLV